MRDEASEEELESFVDNEVTGQTKIFWFLWCDPLKKSCWLCFQEFKRALYRFCRGSPKAVSMNDDSTHHSTNSMLPASSTRLSVDEEAPSSILGTRPSSLPHAVRPAPYSSAPSSSLPKAAAPYSSAPYNSAPSSSLPKAATPYSSPPYSSGFARQDESLSTSGPHSQNRSLFQSTNSQRFQSSTSSQSTNSQVEMNSIHGVSSPPATPGGVVGSDALKPKKASLSELYGSQSSRLYGKRSDESAA
jgi:hypothetical protein